MILLLKKYDTHFKFYMSKSSFKRNMGTSMEEEIRVYTFAQTIDFAEYKPIEFSLLHYISLHVMTICLQIQSWSEENIHQMQ